MISVLSDHLSSTVTPTPSLLSTCYCCETTNHDVSVHTTGDIRFSFTCLQLGWSSSAFQREVLLVNEGSLAPHVFHFLGTVSYLEVYSAYGNGKSTRGQALLSKHITSLCMCALSPSISLAKACQWPSSRSRGGMYALLAMRLGCGCTLSGVKIWDPELNGAHSYSPPFPFPPCTTLRFQAYYGNSRGGNTSG